MLWKKGVAMDPDLNNYDIEHVCTGASADERGRSGSDIYQEAWSLYYTPRAHEDAAAARRGDRRADAAASSNTCCTFSTTDRLEKRASAARRHSPAEASVASGGRALPRESAWTFWPRFAWQTL